MTALAASTLPFAVPASASTTPDPARSPLVRAAALAPSPAPKGSVALGRATADQPMQIEVMLSPSDQSGISSLVSALYDPSSPSYHHWLRPGQFAARFAPSAASVSATESWLSSRGLHARRDSEFALVATASAGTLSGALGTTFERYRTPAGAEGYVASSAPEVPSGLAPEIRGILGLNTLPTSASDISTAPPSPSAAPLTSTPSSAVRSPDVSSTPLPSACPAAVSTSGSRFYTLDRLGAAYGIGSLFSEGLTGAGQTLAVFELAAHSPADVSAYESCFGLSVPVSTVAVAGGGASGGGTVEADMDIEQAATQAPGASIISYEGPNTDAGSYATWNAAVSADRAQVISSSWGWCESYAQQTGEMASLSTLFQQAAAQGQTVVVASGDTGSEGCYQTDQTTGLEVDYPASDPLVTAVGGTSLLGPGDETTWNDCQGQTGLTCAQNGGGAGGGGLSRFESRPSYQSAVPAWSTAQACGTTCRGVPDISANSGVGMVLYSQGNWQVGAGTSFAAPFIAGLVADRNEGCSSATGQFNPTIYSLAAAGGYGAGLTDVTTGDNDLTLTNGLQYQAGSGWDGATGLGSPLAGGLSCPEVQSVSPTTAAPGATVTVAGTGLEGATISFGGLPANVISASATQATVTVPSGSGSATVSASGGLGIGTITAPFSYATSSGGSTSGGSSSGGASPTGTPTTTATSAPPPPNSSTSPAPITTASTPSCPSTAGAPLPGAAGIAAVRRNGCAGYLVVDSAGQVSAFGAAAWHGDLSGVHLSAPIIAIQSTPDGGGYWMLGSDGGVFPFGDAGFFGSTGGIHLAAPVVGMSASPDGQGYWIVARDGGVFSFGDAGFHGSTGGIKLAQPVDGIAVAPGGNGYWLVASDGGVFAFTSDGFYGSLGGVRLARPVVGMSGTADGRGYTLVGSDGGVFSFGDAPFYGSLGANPPASPIVDLSPAPGGNGYYLVTAAGNVFTFGPGATNFGSV